MIRPPPRSPLFPYPPLSRSQRPADTSRADERDLREVLSLRDADPGRRRRELVLGLADIGPALEQRRRQPDRKSTRLNSSHGYISYAVFCLKKKKQENNTAYV